MTTLGPRLVCTRPAGAVALGLLYVVLAVTDASALVVRHRGETVVLDEVTIDGRDYVRLDELSVRFQCDEEVDVVRLRATLTNASGMTLEMAVGSDEYRLGDAVFAETEPPLLDPEGNVLVPTDVVNRRLLAFLGATPLRKIAEAPPPGQASQTPTPTQTPTMTPLRIMLPTETPVAARTATDEDTEARPRGVPTPPVEQEDAGVVAADLLRRIDTLLIDIGPTVLEPGATGVYDLVEYEVCREVARSLARAAEHMLPLQVVYTIDPGERVQARNALRWARASGVRNGLLVSLHAGGALAPDISGATVFYMSERYDHETEGSASPGTGEGRPWSQTYLPHAGASRILALSLYQSLQEDPATRVLPPRDGRFALLRGLDMPAVIVQVGTVTSTADARFLRRPDHLRALGVRLADGIARFLRLDRSTTLEQSSLVTHDEAGEGG